MSDLEHMAALVDGIARDLPHMIQTALFERGETIMTAAKERTPVRFGLLRASGRVEAPPVDANEMARIRLAFGGGFVDYAGYVHGDPRNPGRAARVHHTTGQALFLSSAVEEAMPTLARDLADDVMRGIRERVR